LHFEKWPVHCVQGSPGAEFHPQLASERLAEIFSKGTGDKDDGYSAFEATNLDLESYLRARNVRRLFVCGLATDYCVKATALDALAKGFEVVVIEDGVAAVEAKPGDGRRALEELRRRGATVASSRELEGAEGPAKGPSA
jgi:nicotinamidase/pyrazinamidase